MVGFYPAKKDFRTKVYEIIAIFELTRASIH